MLTTYGAIDQNLFYALRWIYYCLIPKRVMQMKHLPSTFPSNGFKVNKLSTKVTFISYFIICTGFSTSCKVKCDTLDKNIINNRFKQPCALIEHNFGFQCPI